MSEHVGGARPVVAAERRGHRAELQGLRALAVALVVVYHVWIGRVSGGVDVFFVLTGFFLTAQLVRAAERGPVPVRERWNRSLARLTPAAALVLVVTAAVSVAVLPEGRWIQTIREVAAAAVFVENWQLAADSVDYAARSGTTSAVQHFWSLSIQTQVVLLWPLLVAVVALSARGSRDQLRTRLTAALAVVFVVSLAYSVELTAANQPLAYFHTLTRLWEFAAGGLLALHADRVALSARTRIAAGWTGSIGLVACGVLIPVVDVFPGYAALWPTSCAALVILAARTGSPWSADRLLASRPARYLGDLSYALYLWHWPVLILYTAASGDEHVGLRAGLVVVGLSLVLAAATHHLVEEPLRRRVRTRREGVLVSVAVTTAVLLTAATWHLVAEGRANPVAQAGQASHPGAGALLGGPVEPAPILPPPVAVTEDWVRVDHWDCRPMHRFAGDVCTRPPASPTADRERAPRVLAVGDSHVQQLTGALLPLADANGWELTAVLRGACPFSTVSEVVPDDPECLAWNAAALEEIDELRPDLVITLASRDVREGLTEVTPPGFVEQWRELERRGLGVLAVRDNPRFAYSVPDCVQQQEDPGHCGVPRAQVYSADPPWSGLSDVPGNVGFLDTADAVCTPDDCPAVLGNVLVYLDDNHLSASYTTSMAPLLADRIEQAVGR